MYAAPQSFYTALGTGYQVTAFADLWTQPGMIGPNLNPVPVQFIARLYIEDGTITVDGTAPQRRTCDLTLAPYTDPGRANLVDLLGPGIGQFNSKTCEVRISFAAQPPTGPPFLALLGIFTVNDVQAQDTGTDIVFTLSGADRSAEISRHAFTHEYPQANGVPTTQAMVTMIGHAVPGFVQAFDINLTIPGSWPPAQVNDWPTAPYVWPSGQDAWQACQQMANTAGLQLYFSPSGRCTMRPIPNFQQGQATSVNPMGGPIWVYRDGAAFTPVGGGLAAPPMLCGVTRVDTAENQGGGTASGSNTNAVPNSVLVIAETTWVPYGGVYGSQLSDTAAFQVQAVDDDRASPTYVGGPYGVVSNVIYDDLLTSVAEGKQEALLALQQGLSAGEQVVLDVLPNPMHEVWDVVRVIRSRLGVSALYTIQKWTFPLNPARGTQSRMQVTCNKVTGPGGLYSYPVPVAAAGLNGYGG